MKKATAMQAQLGKTAQPKAGSDAVTLLKADHRKVEGLFAQFENTQEPEEKHKLVQQICLELIIHTKLEEELFYPACREKSVEDDLMDEAQVEHDGAKVLIGDLLSAQPDSGFYDAKVKTLSEYIRHHVAEEEKPRSGIFAKAKQQGVDITGMGQKIQSRKAELMAESEAMTSEPPQPRSFQLQPQKESNMARNSNDRDRDERGRFTDDDSRGGSQSRDRDERGRFGANDNRGGYQSRGQDQDRDERGRFTGDDNRGDYQSRGRGRSGDDDDNRDSRGGRGGWFGDSEGHSRASREGWEDRGSSRSRGYDDDDRGRSSQSRSGSGGGGGGRGQGGWFGDSEGHSQASREGWRSSGHEGSGWYGDPEGHSRASREGWEDRGGSRYSGQQSSGRGRQDDDDRGSRGGRGHGGWFGDSEGHSDAAREGWRNR